jgi:hypothetical protein
MATNKGKIQVMRRSLKTTHSKMGGSKIRCLAIRGVALTLAFVTCSVSVSRADYISPENMVVRTEVYAPQHTQIEFGTYTYDLSWQGIPVGTAHVKISVPSQTSGPTSASSLVSVRADAKSAKGIDLFYKLRHTSESVFDARSLKPLEFKTSQSENSSRREAEVSFAPDGSITSRYKKKNKEVRFSFNPKNLVLDPITAAFYAKSIAGPLDHDVTFDVFNAKNRYLIQFKYLGIESVDVEGRQVQAYKFSPAVNMLTDTEGEKRIQKAYLWVSTDENRDVLKLASEVWIGSVTAQLVRFKPEPGEPSSVIRAALPADPRAQLGERLEAQSSGDSNLAPPR